VKTGAANQAEPAGDVALLTVAEAGALLRSRQLSPVDLAERHLRRIEALDGQISAFLLVTADEALRAARQAEADIVQGAYKGPLHGIPFGLKDVYDTAGIATTGNSPAFRTRIPGEDAEVVRRLRKAGAVLLGKQATHELTYGGVSTELPWPPPRNPWDLSRDTGGSSSGSGAAVAAGLSMFAMGTDTGGSVRNPAAHCGLAGFKPSFGLVSRRGVMMNAFSLDHCGPLARSVQDCALVLNAIVGHDPRDPASLRDVPPCDYAQSLDGGLAGLRIGHIAHLYEQDLPAAPEARAAMADALAQLAALGARIEEVAIAPLDHYARVKATIQRAEIHAEYAEELQRRPDAFGRKLMARMAAGRGTAAADYLQAQQERRRLTVAMAGLFEQVDLLVTGGPHGPAPLLQTVVENWVFDAPEMTVPFSLTRMPALCLPIGFTPTGLPLSMQIIGPRLGDHAVLRAGHAYQSVTAWHERRPAIAMSSPRA
jgi:aspartyl-tRNA(Asn)/glutamyl-tRNA(Gln) amidotransferase subunit A